MKMVKYFDSQSAKVFLESFNAKCLPAMV